MAALEKSVGEAAVDLPLITQDVRKTLASADKFVNDLDSILIQNSDEIEAFMRAGLPQFVRFTQEARKLVQNLERVTQKIERDPARFLLGTQSPEFRR
jgi:phospholipid/cholesterol/gamma-HCH transport system substrate-binding protein